MTKTYTDQQKYDEIERELRYRRRVYHGLWRQGKMSAQEKDERIACMEAILEDYRERLNEQGDLFDE